MRIASTGPALAANGPSNSFYAAFEPTSAIKGLRNFKAVKGQSLVLQFDSQGAMTNAFTAVELSQVKAVVYSPEAGLFVMTESAIFKVGASK